jgi:hypothetical protein
MSVFCRCPLNILLTTCPGFTLAVYHGARGRQHYFECQQLLLRKQVAALTGLWSLPPEFEVIFLSSNGFYADF